MEVTVISSGEDFFEVFGTRVPDNYLDGHGDFNTSITLAASNGKRPTNSWYITCHKKEGTIDFLIHGEKYMTVGMNHITVRGQKLDRSDPVKHAIQVYSNMREFANIFQANLTD